MRKFKLREIKEFVREGLAKDISKLDFNQVEELLKNNIMDKIGYSTGTYGINGGIIQDRKTGERFAIVGRSITLLMVF